MKLLIYIVILGGISIASCGKKIPANSKSDTFLVSGNCGMCKKTIEKSLRIEGVYDADWNKKTKMMKVVYEPSIISLDQIKMTIAKAGYDNDGYKADSADYEGLHSCCKYDRDRQI